MKNRATNSRAKKRGIALYLARLSHLSTTITALLTGFVGIALFSYHPHDPSWFYYSSEPLPTLNYAGPLGAQVAAFCFYLWGKAAYVLLGIGVYLTYCLWQKKMVEEEFDRAVALGTLLFSWSAFLSVHAIGQKPYMLAGGYLGNKTFLWLVSLFDAKGAVVFLYIMLLCQVLLISRLSGMQLIVWLHAVIASFVRHRALWTAPLVRAVTNMAGGIWYGITQLAIQLKHFFSHFASPKKLSGQREGRAMVHKQEIISLEQNHMTEQPAAVEQPVEGPAVVHQSKRGGVFMLPPLTLFATAPKQERTVKDDESKQSAALLEEKLMRFGIAGTIVGVKKGPVVTLFEYQPTIDTKLSKIVPLEQDLALALEALSVRIVAPIPGTSLVGFEVSNRERKSVRMGDIATSTHYKKSSAALPMILGEDSTGSQVVVDLVDMPHLLVAGSTGSGKSIALNTMLMSLVCRLTPEELRLIIVDPKRLEFAAYHDIPHLLFPVITDPHRAAPVIRWLVKLMEERYQLMAEVGVRSVKEYKQWCVQGGKKDELPFIVLMIDELADLMMVAGKENEEGLARLAQMARAAGIHLIVATQRPSVDVVTGVIKVNFPSRISFRLTSKIDSRTILDQAGAEALLGKGDMLFMDAQSGRIRRVHGAYVSDTEIKKITDHLRSQQRPHYIDLQEVVEMHHAHHQDMQEPLLQEIIQYLNSIDEVSISLLQRRFKIGYNRSARVIELLEMQGKVLPADGSKMRKVVK